MAGIKNSVSFIVTILFLINNLAFADPMTLAKNSTAGSLDTLAGESRLSPITSSELSDITKLTAKLAYSVNTSGENIADVDKTISQYIRHKIATEWQLDTLTYEFDHKKILNDGTIFMVSSIHGIKPYGDKLETRYYLCRITKVDDGSYDYEFLTQRDLEGRTITGALEDEDLLEKLSKKTRDAEVIAKIGELAAKQAPGAGRKSTAGSQVSVSEMTNAPQIYGHNLSVIKRNLPQRFDTPQITGVIVAAGKNTVSLEVCFPGNDIPQQILTTMSLADLAKFLNLRPENMNGNPDFQIGGAMVFPCPFWTGEGSVNDKGEVMVKLPDERIIWVPTNVGEEGTTVKPRALHYFARMISPDQIEVISTLESQNVKGKGVRGIIMNTADAKHSWPGDLKVTTDTIVTDSGELVYRITQKNVGAESTYTSATMHDYFNFGAFNTPRRDVCLMVPGQSYVPLKTNPDGSPDFNDYEPTGETLSVINTPYNYMQFTPLGDNRITHLFTDLIHNKDGSVTAALVFPDSGYMLSVTANDEISRADGSKETGKILGILVHAPNDQPNICIEPASNLTHPFSNDIWKDRPTGMVELKPGETYTYEYRIKLGRTPESPSLYPRSMDKSQKIAMADPIEVATKQISDLSQEALPKIPADLKERKVAVVIQSGLIENANTELVNKYKFMLKELRKKFGDESVVAVESDKASDFAGKVLGLTKNGYKVIGITNTSLAAGLYKEIPDKQRTNCKIISVDQTGASQLENAFQFLNINYLTLMGLAALEGDADLFRVAYRVVTNDNPPPGIMSEWIMRVLPRIVKLTDKANADAAIRKLFDVSA